MSKAKSIAYKIDHLATQLGWEYFVTPKNVLVITKRITKVSEDQTKSSDEFALADSEYGSILGLLPQTSLGSVWGTDGGSVGGFFGMKNGLVEMKKSGGSVRVLNWLKKLKVAKESTKNVVITLVEV